MRKIWKLLPHFIVEWIAVNYGNEIEMQNQRWYVISYKKNLGNTFVVRNKEIEQIKSWDDSEYYDESPCGDTQKHNFSVMKIGRCYACKRIGDSS